MSVRVRFAPSPTGRPHLGGFRTALFQELFARHHKGVHVLRIEDTDRSRYSPESEDELVASLAWLGVHYDEGPHVGGPHGPYRQSERKEAGIYAKWIAPLLEAGHAYKAFETAEELEEMREYQKFNHQPTGYFGGAWRDASEAKVEEAERTGTPFVIRQRIPRDKTISIEDAIRGRIEWDSNTIDDPVLLKADGMPTYHFAAMVDDHLMEITHIIRGEEWISSAPKHAELFDMFGWERPVFVHCPVVLGKDGKKLSKRHGDTRALDFRSQGFLPEALANFLSLIGWSPGGDREVMTREEMIEAFDLAGLQPSPGVFDLEKMRWMNGMYLRAMQPQTVLAKTVELVKLPETAEYWTEKEFEQGQPDPAEVWSALVLLEKAAEQDPDLALGAVRLEQERVHTLAEFGIATHFFLQEEPPMDPKAVEKWFGEPHVLELFDFLIERLSEPRTAVAGSPVGDEASEEWCESMIRQFAEKHGFEKLGPVVHPTRVALTGRTVGPGLFELMSVLGTRGMVARLNRAKGFVR